MTLAPSDITTFVREDDNPVAEVFRAVCREQLGRVPQIECHVRDNPAEDVMEVVFVCVGGCGRVELAPMVLHDQGKLSMDEWRRQLRCEMRRWFRGVRKGRVG